MCTGVSSKARSMKCQPPLPPVLGYPTPREFSARRVNCEAKSAAKRVELASIRNECQWNSLQFNSFRSAKRRVGMQVDPEQVESAS